MSRISKGTKKIRRRHYSQDEKTQVIAQLLSPGCTVEEVAKSTSISRTTLHEWRRGALFVASSRVASQQDGLPNLLSPDLKNISDLPANFVEIDVADIDKSSGLNKDDNSKVTDDDRLNLSEASLTFEDFSLNIKGKFDASRLIAMLDLLARQ